MGESQKSQYAAPALEKGLDILEYLAAQRSDCSQRDIAQALGRSQSEIYRMLTCLEQRGYILKEEATGSYRLSLRLYGLAHRHSATALLRRAAQLPMDSLAEATGQSCHLSVQHGGSMIVLMERMPSQRVCLAVGEGVTLPLSQTTSGKMLLSRMPTEVAREALNNDEYFAAASARAKQALLTELTDLRQQKHLVTSSPQTESAMDIAVPVGIDNTDTAAVITVPFISLRNARSKTNAAYVKAALAWAQQINQNLGILP